MKRMWIVCAAALVLLLSSCSRPPWPVPITYAKPDKPVWTGTPGAKATTPDAYLSETVPPPADPSPVETPEPSPDEPPPSPKPSPNPPPVPSPAPSPEQSSPVQLDVQSTPNVDEALQRANESLSDGDERLIEDLSVGQLLNAPQPPEELLIDLQTYVHYIEQNDARYKAFLTAFPDMPVSMALALCNVNADYGYYQNITIIDDPGNLLVLCNKNFKLPKNFAPDNLRAIAGSQSYMTDAAAAAFEAMSQALNNELGLSLYLRTAYRDYSFQNTLYTNYASKDGVSKADTYSARAGHSEHQTGLAIDFLQNASTGSLRKANFQDSEQYQWLLQHAHEYGYILRYPEGYESVTGYRFEPWHWRYIGVEDATAMFDAGMKTFEEYIGTFYPF